jgi:hypothetical protein
MCDEYYPLKEQIFATEAIRRSVEIIMKEVQRKQPQKKKNLSL